MAKDHRLQSGASRFLVPILPLALLATGFSSMPASAAPAGMQRVSVAASGAGVSRPADLATLRATYDPSGTPKYQRSTRSRLAPLAVTGVATANITVTYSPGFDSAARNAFQAAVDVWRQQIVSSVPIRIDAQWTPLGAGVLGQAGPVDFRRDFAGAPKTNTYYADAVANALAGRDLDPSKPEIEARFNSSFSSWYKGTDGVPGFDQYDFMSVVLHELGHGLGFVGTLDGLTPPNWTDTGRGYWGMASPGDSPTSFDRLVVDGASQYALDTRRYPQGSTLLGELIRGSHGGMRWQGAQAIAGNGGVTPSLYAPASFESGSSVSHLDEATYPAGSLNALMTPYLSNNESVHDPGSIVRGILIDVGWPTTIEPTNAAINERYAALGGSAGLLGPATTTQFRTADSVGRFVVYRNGVIYWSPSSGAHEVHGSVRGKWLAIGAEGGLLRYPVSDERVAPDGVGRLNDFQGGSVYWSSRTGAFELHGAIRTEWQQMKSVTGVLRYPTTDERVAPDRVGRYNQFQGGSIYWTPATGAHEVHGAIREKWIALGWERGRLGYPTGDETAVAEGRRSTFQHGSITFVARTGALVVRYS